MNWFVESLEKTGLRIGIPKMHVDFDTVDDLHLSEYCKNDVRIEIENFRLFIRFLEENQYCPVCAIRGEVPQWRPTCSGIITFLFISTITVKR